MTLESARRLLTVAVAPAELGAGRSGALFVVGSGVLADVPAERSEVVSGPVG